MAEPNGTETGFRWSEKAHRAAVLVSEDDISDIEIAASVGIGRTTLHRWKLNKDFAAQVAHHTEDLNRAMLRLSIAKKRKRLEVLDDLHTRQLRVIELRAARHTADTGAPEEATTGLLVREETVSPNGTVTVKWAFDAALVKEIRATEDQAADELGQKVSRVDVSGMVQVVRVIGANVEAL